MASQSPVRGRSIEPCAATASFFLFAQGPMVICLHHDSLAVERRFQFHEHDIVFISPDNVSERGLGRLVVSYDVAKNAVIWDIFTGAEIARFTSFDQLSVAAWMRNGNLAFGESRRILEDFVMLISTSWIDRKCQGGDHSL